MRLKKIPAVRLCAALIMVWAMVSLPVEAAGRLNVVVTTSLLQSAVREIGGKHVSVSTLIPPGSCPGHYDICPQDIRKLSSSKLVLTHGYEGFVDNILKSMGRNKPKLVKISTSGNWMVPDVYVCGAKRVCDALCKADPKHSAEYRKSLSSLETRAKGLAAQLQKESKTVGTSKFAVLCSDQQKAFMKWMGFKVIGTYTRAEEFTPAELHKLTADARKKHVKLVIDNLQSGPTAGKELAKDISAAHVTLSNFPGGFARTDTWSKCLQDNVNRLMRGIRKR
ncbi:MAG: metal ABC transporter substrate-binding protein [Armatimonadota bacterium]